MAEFLSQDEIDYLLGVLDDTEETKSINEDKTSDIDKYSLLTDGLKEALNIVEYVEFEIKQYDKALSKYIGKCFVTDLEFVYEDFTKKLSVYFPNDISCYLEWCMLNQLLEKYEECDVEVTSLDKSHEPYEPVKEVMREVLDTFINYCKRYSISVNRTERITDLDISKDMLEYTVTADGNEFCVYFDTYEDITESTNKKKVQITIDINEVNYEKHTAEIKKLIDMLSDRDYIHDLTIKYTKVD